MKHLSIIEIAKLTALITKGGFKRTATKDIAIAKFNEAVAERNKTTPTSIPDNWATGLTFSEAFEKLTNMLAGKAPAEKAKKGAKKEVNTQPVRKKVRIKGNGGGRVGVRNKKLFPTQTENPFRSGKSLATYAAIMKSPGKTFRQYVDNDGLRTNTIALAIRNNWLRLEE